MTTTILVAAIAVLGLTSVLVSLALVRWLHVFTLAARDERLHLQSEIDTLVEQLLRINGIPVDLNRAARERYKSAVTTAGEIAHPVRNFSGFRSDSPATPPRKD